MVHATNEYHRGNRRNALRAAGVRLGWMPSETERQKRRAYWARQLAPRPTAKPLTGRGPPASGLRRAGSGPQGEGPPTRARSLLRWPGPRCPILAPSIWPKPMLTSAIAEGGRAR